MIATRSRGGGVVSIDDRIDVSGDDLERLGARIGDLTTAGLADDFDLATLLTQVPAPLTALRLDAARLEYHGQLAS